MQVDLLKILKTVVNSNNVNMEIFSKEKAGVEEVLHRSRLYEEIFAKPNEEYKENTLYCVVGCFEEEYCMFQTPKEEGEDIIVIGPYRRVSMNKYELGERMETQSISMLRIEELEEYYNSIPMITNPNAWIEIIGWVVKTFYEKSDVKIRFLEYNKDFWNLALWGKNHDMDKGIVAKLLEERYNLEKELLGAISQGHMEKALKYLNQLEKYKIARRYKEIYRDYRNLLISFNTLCRKAVEQACVHPIHIDALSTKFAKQVETIYSEGEVSKLHINMVRKYCMLVNNYSLRGYSPLIQKIINYIDLNLIDDLSLKVVSEKFSINASYLSDIFKKEVKMTFTSYVNNKRIRQAILYLNSSHMQIQEIAVEVGISDVNYFTKLFKKVIGKTPREYRNSILIEI